MRKIMSDARRVVIAIVARARYAAIYRRTLSHEIGWLWAYNYPLPEIGGRDDPHDDAIEELAELRDHDDRG